MYLSKTSSSKLDGSNVPFLIDPTPLDTVPAVMVSMESALFEYVVAVGGEMERAFIIF